MDTAVKGSEIFFFFFSVHSGCFKRVLPKMDLLPWETINESLTSIQVLTAPNWVYNNDGSDPLRNEKLTQRNLDKCSLSVLPPWKISLALAWKSNEYLGDVILVMGNDASD